MKSGIVGYGVSIPHRRINVRDIVGVWGNTSVEALTTRLKINERAVLFFNEDTNTLAIEASKNALKQCAMDPKVLGALYLGTGTNPWASNPSSPLIAESIGAVANIMCSDLQFSGKSGTSAIQVCLALAESGMTSNGLAVGADTLNRHVAPGEMYEYTASAGAAAFVIGRERNIVKVLGTASVASSLCDWFRIEGERYIKTSDPSIPDAISIGLEEHVTQAVKALNHTLGLGPGDYSQAVFQQPYGYVPFKLGLALGFTKQQVLVGEISEKIGDCGAASALLGLANVLDHAKAGDRILLASYGFGAGSDAFALEVTKEIEDSRGRTPMVEDLLANKEMVDYGTAIKHEHKFLRSLYPLGPWT